MGDLEVLSKAADVLGLSGGSWASEEAIRAAVGWGPDRDAELQVVILKLIENGDLLGPRRGPLRDGAGRVISADVIGLTEKGRQRLAEADRPLPVRVARRSWPALLKAWGDFVIPLVLMVAGGLLLALLTPICRGAS
jgi:hypothetical protein